MKWRLIICFFFFGLCCSCHKEYSCENCLPGNPRPPVQGPQDAQAPAIASLNCGGGSFSSPAVEATLYSGRYIIAYTGGNAVAYKADTISSTGVTGLTAILVSGTLANGNGNLIYNISGTPVAAGDANFSISFGGQNCTATLRIDPVVTVLNGLIRIPIAAEKDRCMVLLGNGKVKAWGNNQFGQLGDGTTIDRNTPVEVSMLTNIAAVAVGAYHSLALRSDGKVWAWGKNDDGELGDGTLAENHFPKLVDGLSNIISIAAGFDYSLALKNDGTVWAWGGNIWGVLGDGTYTNALHPVQVMNLSGIIAITAGTEHCLALKNDGTVWSWGWNAYGCLGDGSNVIKRPTAAKLTGLSGITAIASNCSFHSLALKSDGTVWTWGDNFYGQLGDGTSIERHVPVELTSIKNVTSIGTGERHSFAIKNDGSLWAWGWNGNGQLGVDNTLSYSEPIPVNVTLLPGVKRIVGGSYHSLAQKNDGNVFTMGNNVWGQLGDGTNVQNRYVPTIVTGL